MDTIVLTEAPSGLLVIALIVSVIIAYGIQFLLSLLSVATGVSMTPDLKKVSAKAKAHSLYAKDTTHHPASDDEEDDKISRRK